MLRRRYDDLVKRLDEPLPLALGPYLHFISAESCRQLELVEEWARAAGGQPLPNAAIENAEATARSLIAARSRALHAAAALLSEAEAEIADVANSTARVVEVAPAGGDQHGGFEVLKLTLEDGTAVAARPWPTSAPSLLADVSELLDFPFGVPTSKEVVSGGRSWQLLRWIPPGAAMCESEIERCYEGFGALAATAWFLGVTDLHAENVVVNARPWVIDPEFLFEPMQTDSALAFTGLIDPARAPVPVQGAIDGPPAFHAGRQLGGHRSASFPKGRIPCHRPLRLDDTFAHPSDHLSALAHGFRSAALRLKNDAVCLKPAGTRSRRLVRPTAVYQAFLDELACPNVLPREARTASLVGRLVAMPGGPGAELAAVAGWEAEDLIAGDLPHFTARCDRSELIHTTTGLKVPVSTVDGATAFAARVKTFAEEENRLLNELLAAARRALREQASLPAMPGG
jgi:hypothetical protein